VKSLAGTPPRPVVRQVLAWPSNAACDGKRAHRLIDERFRRVRMSWSSQMPAASRRPLAAALVGDVGRMGPDDVQQQARRRDAGVPHCRRLR